MTELSQQADRAPSRFPLSVAQDFFCSMDYGDQGGAFSFRFIIVVGWRITGHLDVPCLREALDDVVVRHEALRTVVVRDAQPPYQQVFPPSPVSLEVRDLVPAPGASRDLRAEELVIEVEQGTMSPLEPPLLRGVLGRFDDRDWVLLLVTHHSASDGWSMEVIMRDLAALYAARTGGKSPQLPDARQYREYSAWQRASLTGAVADKARAYWQEKLRGARVFTLPTARPVPQVHSRPYSTHYYTIDADAMAPVYKFAKAVRSSLFMVMLAAFNVLAYRITGTTDPAIQALTTGRNEPRFRDTVGLFLNEMPFRTDISGCASFRDIVARTRTTCLEAYSHEIPMTHLDQQVPEYTRPHDEEMRSAFALGFFQVQLDQDAAQLAEGTTQIVKRELPDQDVPDPPKGVFMDFEVLPSGELMCSIQFNLDEFDEPTVLGWVADYSRILSRSVSQPDQDWKTL